MNPCTGNNDKNKGSVAMVHNQNIPAPEMYSRIAADILIGTLFLQKGKIV